MTDTAESLIGYSRDNSRVCPMPMQWDALWELLPNRQRVGNGWEPALPLILAAWYDTPALIKMLRLEEHIRWADKQKALNGISTFLRSLPEDQWLHLGE